MKKIYIQCPTCNKKFQYSSSNEYRPFCSKRCKLIDFGAWNKEQYKIK